MKDKETLHDLQPFAAPLHQVLADVLARVQLSPRILRSLRATSKSLRQAVTDSIKTLCSPDNEMVVPPGVQPGVVPDLLQQANVASLRVTPLQLEACPCSFLRQVTALTLVSDYKLSQQAFGRAQVFVNLKSVLPLQSLRHLSIQHCLLRSGTEVLLHLKHLQSLDLTGLLEVTNKVLSLLPRITSLTSLSLPAARCHAPRLNQCTPQGLHMCLPLMKRLTALHLKAVDMEPLGAVAVAQLEPNPLGHPAVVRSISGRTLQHLTSLSLEGLAEAIFSVDSSMVITISQSCGGQFGRTSGYRGSGPLPDPTQAQDRPPTDSQVCIHGSGACSSPHIGAVQHDEQPFSGKPDDAVAGRSHTSDSGLGGSVGSRAYACRNGPLHSECLSQALSACSTAPFQAPPAKGVLYESLLQLSSLTQLKYLSLGLYVATETASPSRASTVEHVEAFCEGLELRLSQAACSDATSTTVPVCSLKLRVDDDLACHLVSHLTQLTGLVFRDAWHITTTTLDCIARTLPDLQLLDLEGSCRSLCLHHVSHLSPLMHLHNLGLGRWSGQAWYPPFRFKNRLDAYEAAQAEHTAHVHNTTTMHAHNGGLPNRAMMSYNGLAPRTSVSEPVRGYHSVNGLPGPALAYVNEYKDLTAGRPHGPAEFMMRADDEHQHFFVQPGHDIQGTDFLMSAQRQRYPLHGGAAAAAGAAVPAVDTGGAWLYSGSACGPDSACTYQDIDVDDFMMPKTSPLLHTVGMASMTGDSMSSQDISTILNSTPPPAVYHSSAAASAMTTHAALMLSSLQLEAPTSLQHHHRHHHRAHALDMPSSLSWTSASGQPMQVGPCNMTCPGVAAPGAAHHGTGAAMAQRVPAPVLHLPPFPHQRPPHEPTANAGAHHHHHSASQHSGHHTPPLPGGGGDHVFTQRDARCGMSDCVQPGCMQCRSTSPSQHGPGKPSLCGTAGGGGDDDDDSSALWRELNAARQVSACESSAMYEALAECCTASGPGSASTSPHYASAGQLHTCAPGRLQHLDVVDELRPGPGLGHNQLSTCVPGNQGQGFFQGSRIDPLLHASCGALKSLSHHEKLAQLDLTAWPIMGTGPVCSVVNAAPKLQVLKLTACQGLTAADIHELSALKDLQKLDLSYTSLCRDIIIALPSLPSLNEVMLTHASLAWSASKAMAKVAVQHSIRFSGYADANTSYASITSALTGRGKMLGKPGSGAQHASASGVATPTNPAVGAAVAAAEGRTPGDINSLQGNGHNSTSREHHVSRDVRSNICAFTPTSAPGRPLGV